VSPIRRHPLAAYLVIVYGLGLVIYALPLLGSTGLQVLPIELPGVAPFILASTIMLTIVAFGVTAAAEAREGVRELRSRAFPLPGLPTLVPRGRPVLACIGLRRRGHLRGRVRTVQGDR
jgi:hypothetical protein